MPSPNTFEITPIATLLCKWLTGRKSIIDPFARSSWFANYRNDLNPETTAEYHMDAVDFLKLLALGVEADAFLFDPPYSPRQISECYQQIGRAVGTKETQNARLYKECKDAADLILIPGAVVICCGWNSAGMGKKRGYRMEEILLVAHGGAHNDTIVTVETKL